MEDSTSAQSDEVTQIKALQEQKVLSEIDTPPVEAKPDMNVLPPTYVSMFASERGHESEILESLKEDVTDFDSSETKEEGN